MIGRKGAQFLELGFAPEAREGRSVMCGYVLGVLCVNWCNEGCRIFYLLTSAACTI